MMVLIKENKKLVDYFPVECAIETCKKVHSFGLGSKSYEKRDGSDIVRPVMSCSKCRKKFYFDREMDIISYGGGVNSSAYYFFMVKKLGIKPDHVVFADTGNEGKKTYKTVTNMVKQCFKDRVPFNTERSHLVEKHGSLRDAYYFDEKVMSFKFRSCSDKFKVRVVRKFLREKYGKKVLFNMHLGIAYEELTRMKPSKTSFVNHVFLFVENKEYRKDNIKLLKEYNFKASKSGCMGCLFMSSSGWFDLLHDDLEEYMQWEELEKHNKEYPRILSLGTGWERMYPQKNKPYFPPYSIRTSVLTREEFRLKYINYKKNPFNDKDSVPCNNLEGACFM